MPEFGVKYSGLHKRDSYEGLIDYLENKQEKLKLPDREAKFVRDSPQYQTLLNEGFVEIEEQQWNQIEAEQAEHSVIRTANDTNETAKEVKVVASQTDKPLLVKTKSTGTQSAQIETKSTHSKASPLIFDLTVNDNIKKVTKDIESVEDTQTQNKLQQALIISRKVQHNLGEQATPETTYGFAHKMASMASSSIQTIGRGLYYLSSPSSSQDPNTSLLHGDGRGKQDLITTYINNPPQLSLSDKRIPTPKPKSYNAGDAMDTSYKQTGSKNKTLALEDLNLNTSKKAKSAPPPAKPKGSAPAPPAKAPPAPPAAKPKAKASTPPVIKTGLKNTKPAVVNLLTQPSKMGFKKLEQELTANSSKMVGADIALVADLVKQHKDARGGVNTKIVKGTVVKRLQEIYKRVLYNK